MDTDLESTWPSFPVDCDTCPAAATSACVDCLVTHVLANGDDPVAVVPVRSAAHPSRRRHRRPHPSRDGSGVDEVVGWFVAAGLVADPPRFVSAQEFADHAAGDGGAIEPPSSMRAERSPLR
jgi:hypothetical protein